MSKVTSRVVLAVVAGCSLFAGMTAAASAATRTVTAHSNYGNGAVSGAVRKNRQGFAEVQLPGGGWIDCAGDCREALRRTYLDFWDTMREESGDGKGEGSGDGGGGRGSP